MNQFRQSSLYFGVLALAAFSSSSALAQSDGAPCQSTADCGEGLTCVFGSSGSSTGMTEPGMTQGAPPPPVVSTGGTSSSGTDLAPAEGGEPNEGLVAPPVDDPPVKEPLTGTCGAVPGACTSDDECDEGYYCSIVYSDLPQPAEILCAPNEDCTTKPPPPQPINPGTCLIQQLTCGSGEECPEPATCNDAGYCAYEPTECMSADGCSDGYECIVTSTYEECSVCVGTGSATPASSGMTAPAGMPAPEATAAAGAGSTPVSSGDVAPGSAAAPVPLPPATGTSQPPTCVPTCTKYDKSTCQPAPDPCEADSDCDQGWTCYEIPQGTGTAEAWRGVEKSCVPPGIVAAIEGRLLSSYSGTLGGGTPSSGEGTSGSVGIPMMGPGVPIDDDTTAGTDPLPNSGMGVAGATTSTSAPSGTPPSAAGPGDATPMTEGANPVVGTRAGCTIGALPAPKTQRFVNGSLVAALGIALGAARGRRRAR